MVKTILAVILLALMTTGCTTVMNSLDEVVPDGRTLTVLGTKEKCVVIFAEKQVYNLFDPKEKEACKAYLTQVVERMSN